MQSLPQVQSGDEGNEAWLQAVSKVSSTELHLSSYLTVSSG